MNIFKLFSELAVSALTPQAEQVDIVQAERAALDPATEFAIKADTLPSLARQREFITLNDSTTQVPMTRISIPDSSIAYVAQGWVIYENKNCKLSFEEKALAYQVMQERFSNLPMGKYVPNSAEKDSTGTNIKVERKMHAPVVVRIQNGIAYLEVLKKGEGLNLNVPVVEPESGQDVRSVRIGERDYDVVLRDLGGDRARFDAVRGIIELNSAYPLDEQNPALAKLVGAMQRIDVNTPVPNSILKQPDTVRTGPEEISKTIESLHPARDGSFNITINKMGAISIQPAKPKGEAHLQREISDQELRQYAQDLAGTAIYFGY